MNPQAFIILSIPFVGLIPICRNKKWNWRVVKSSTLVTSLFWTGWFTSLVYGTLLLFRVVE